MRDHLTPSAPTVRPTRRTIAMRCSALVAEVMEDRILHSVDIAPLALSTDLAVHSSVLQPAQVATPDTSVQRSEIVFVDASVGPGSPLLARLQAQRAAGAAIEIVTIQAGQDGLALVGATLSGRSAVGTVDLVPDNSTGTPRLGSAVLDNATLLKRAAEVAGWGAALAADGHLVLHSQGAAAADPASAGAAAALRADLAALAGVRVDTVVDSVVAVPAAAAVALQTSGLALNFETNVGQVAAGTDFIARASGVGIALRGGNATLNLSDGTGSNVVGMTLQGAAAGVAGQAEGGITSRTNYLVGTPDQWRRNVASHASVLYSGVYNGVDLRYYGNGSRLEYDFIVAAGADAGQIALHFDGVDKLSVNAAGALVLTLTNAAGAARTVRFDAPVAYQDGPNGRAAVATHYAIGADGSVRFDIGAHDSSRALVIDPTLAYGTYYGTINTEAARGVAVGSDGSVYLAGSTNHLSLLSGVDAVVVKLAPNLGSVQYTTYIGGLLNGSGDDVANGIAVDSSGSAYVVGTTASSTFYGYAVTGTDMFVVKLSADGSSLVYTIALTSGSNDQGNAIAVDGSGAAYIAATVGNGSATDAAVVKLNAAGNAVVYSTVFSGNGADSGLAIAVNSSGQAAITGNTRSSNLGAYLVGAADNSLSGASDAFVFQLDATGSAVTYGSLFGGNGADTGRAITYRTNGNIYITGDTTSSDLATSSDALQATSAGGTAAFVAVFDPRKSGGSSSLYATYLGGGATDVGRAIAVSSNGKQIYVAGSTTSGTRVVTADAAQPGNAGATDGFFTIIDPTASGAAGLVYSTYLGGSGTDDVYGLAFNSSSNTVVLAGTTTSASGIARAGGADTAFGGSSDAFAVVFDLSTSNTAPVLAGANSLGTIREDPSSNNGVRVSTLIAGRVTDADAGAASGIAVTAVDNSNGQWQYSTGGGGSWNNFGAPSGSNARLLAADSNTYVRFVPNLNWNGTVAAGITLRAWDQTSGTAGNTADTSVNGGGSAFSSATASCGITVTSVNDAPTGANNTVSTNEDTGYTFSAADFGFADPADNPANTLLAVRITTLPGAGTLTNNGIPASMGQDIAVADINAGKLVFKPAPNANGAGYASFTFQVQDNGGTANGGVDLDPTPNTMTVNVAAVNDAPVNSVPGAQETAYNTPLVFSAANSNRIVVSDVDAGAASIQVMLSAGNGTLTLSGTAGLTIGSGSNGSAAMTFTGSIGAINTALDGMRFTPGTNFSGAASVLVQSNDLGNTGAGGPLGASAAVAITVDPASNLVIVNDAYATGEKSNLVAASVLGNDADPSSGVLSVTAVNGNSAAVGNTITLASGALLSIQADGTFIYNPNGAFDRLAQGASATDSFIYYVSSTSATTGVGTVVVTLNGANDAPLLTGSNNLNPINEDPAGNSGTLVAALIAGWVSDADSPAASGIAVTAVNDANGSWQYSTDAGVSWTAFGSPTVGNARLLAADTNTSVRFVPNANWNGALVGGITLRAWDQTSGAAGSSADTSVSGGSSAFSTNTASASITVAAVNDAPSGSNRTVSTKEDTPYVFAVPDFGFSDTADSPANTLAAVTITTVPRAGILSDNGVAVGAGQSVALGDIVAGRLVFTPAANANGAGYASFTFQVQDNGGTANGGIDLDATPRTMTLDVTAVNHAPTLATPIPDQAATRDAPFGFTLAANTFADVDVGDRLSYRATLVSGAALPAWLRFDAATRSFSGTPANADVGAITLQVVATDSGNASVAADFVLRVANTNDAPVLAHAISDRDAVAGTPLVFQLPAATFVDPDVGDTLHYAASLADGSALPAWLGFDGRTQSFSVHAAVGNVGQVVVQVTATDDGGLRAQGRFAITVSAPPPADQAPAPPAAQPVAPSAAVTPVAAPAASTAAAAAVVAPAAPSAAAAPPAAAAPVQLDAANATTVLEVPPVVISIEAPPLLQGASHETVDVVTTARPESRADAVLGEALAPQFGAISASSLNQLMRNDELTRKFEEMQRQMQLQGESRSAAIASSILVTGGVSIGYVVWLVRGGVLMGSMLSALPAWQMIDPLPVLAAARLGKQGRKGQKPGDDAEVERLFDEHAPAPVAAAQPQRSTPARDTTVNRDPT